MHKILLSLNLGKFWFLNPSRSQRGTTHALLVMLGWFIFTRYMRYIYALCDKMVTRPLFLFLVLEFLFLVSLLMNWFVWFFWTGYFHLPVWSPFWDSAWYVFFHYNKLHKRCEPEDVDYQGCVCGGEGGRGHDDDIFGWG